MILSTITSQLFPTKPPGQRSVNSHSLLEGCRPGLRRGVPSLSPFHRRVEYHLRVIVRRPLVCEVDGSVVRSLRGAHSFALVAAVKIMSWRLEQAASRWLHTPVLVASLRQQVRQASQATSKTRRVCSLTRLGLPGVSQADRENGSALYIPLGLEPGSRIGAGQPLGASTAGQRWATRVGSPSAWRGNLPHERSGPIGSS